MVRDSKVQYAILGGGLVVLLAILAWRMLYSGERPPSPDVLAQEALQAATPGEQEVAAVRLAQLGKDAKQHLQRVLAESQSAPVRAACIQGLAAQWDFDSMPVFLDALDDQSALVRGRAGVAVERLLAVDFNYRYNDVPEKRRVAIKLLRERWEKMRDAPILKKWKERQQEGS